MLTEKVSQWLMRAVPDSGISSISEMPVTLGSDIGLVRKENEDRLAMLRVNANSSKTPPFIAVALADGMGGMRDGAECASRTLGAFFNALIRFRQKAPEERLKLAAAEANEEVHQYLRGSGGSTLSALLLDGENRAFTVNVGDSRIYAVSQEAKESKIVRLTVDDSLEEAVGGHGRELLQFIGMGQGLLPHTSAVKETMNRVVLTSDGVHFVSPALLSDILLHAKGNREIVDQLLTVAKWRGAPDNASAATILIKEFQGFSMRKFETNVEISDSFGALYIMWAKQDCPEVNEPVIEVPVPPVERKASGSDTLRGSRNFKPKRNKSNKEGEAEKEVKQLSFVDDPKVEIIIEPKLNKEKGEGSNDDNSL